MELREKIAREVCNAHYGPSADCIKEDYEAADKILAIPEIRDALGLSYKGVKIVEDARLKPGEMKMVSPNP